MEIGGAAGKPRAKTDLSRRSSTDWSRALIDMGSPSMRPADRACFGQSVFFRTFRNTVFPNRDRSVGGLLALLVLLSAQMVAPPAMAQIVAADACPADVAGSSVQCVSQDVSLASVDYEAVNLPPNCVAGETINLNVRLGFVVNANARRYDVATWIAKEAGDIKQPSASGGPSSCSLLVAREQYFSEIPDPPLPAVPNPVDGLLIVDNLDGDICYDTLPAARQYFAADFPNGLAVTCQPGPDGTLTFQTLVSWSTQSRNNCDGTPASFVSEVSNSKCAAGDPIELPINVLSRLVIEKQTNPAGVPDVFNFSGTIDGAPITGFPLSDGQTKQLSGALDATYVITEAVANGFEIDSIVCTNETTGDPATANIDPTTGQVSVTMTPSQFDVRCVYTNNAPAQVTIVKSAEGGDDTFTFDTNLAAPDDVIQLTTSGGGANSGPIIVPVPDSSTPVPVRILEQAVAGWDLADITCSGTDENVVGNEVDFTVQPGDDVTCTFTNVKQGTLTIIKDTVGGDGTFEFTSTSLPGGDFTITTANNTGSVNFGSIAPGGYTVAEVVPAGWDLTSIGCIEIGGTDNSGTISGTEIGIIIESGETVTCTFTNTQRGVIEIEKVTDPNPPSGASPDFRFTSSYVPEFFVANGQTNVSAALVPGTYTVTEDDPSALGEASLGFDLTDLTCVDTPPPGGSAGTDSSGDVDSRTATIHLDPGETVRCTFTNTQRGALVIVKEVTADGPAINTFEFTSNTLTPASFTLGPVSVGSIDAADFLRLEPGTYDVAETVPGGWSLVNASCNDGSTVSNIVIDPGELVICTFTNAPLGSATIVKNTVGGDATFDFTGDSPFGGLSLDTSTIGGTASQDFTNQLDPALNPYTITEEPIPDGWALTNLGCVENGDLDSTVDLGLATATINAQFAEEITCTFTNTLDGTIIIRKETLPDGSADVFQFLGDIAGAISDGGEIRVNLQPGTYTTNEVVPAGWQLTDITCAADPGSSVTESATGVTIDLAAGEVVDCRFTNTLEGSITIRKTVVGNGGTFNFGSATLGSFSLNPADNATDARVFQNRLPGAYIVAENPVPTGYALTDISCSGGSNILIGANDQFDTGDTGVTINLAPGEDVICTFENTELGSITVVKETLPDGSPVAFTFTGDAAGSITDGQAITVSNLLPRTYTSTETVPSGWDLTNIDCIDDDSSGDLNTATATFNIAPGEDIVCTFINIQRATVNVVKDVVNDNGGTADVTDFLIGTSIASLSFDGGTPVDAVTTRYTATLSDVVPGTGYRVLEIDVTGYTEGTWVCTDGTGVNVGGGPFDNGIFNVAAGSTVTCTITNDDDAPSLKLIKNVINDNGGTAVASDWTLSAGSNSVTGSASAVEVTDQAGTYALSESSVAGYTNTSITCDDNPGVEVTSVTIGLGETKTCTFVNDDDAPSLTLVKNVINDNGGTAVASDWTLFAGANSVTGSEAGALATDQAGTYALSESSVAGYTNTSITCDDNPGVPVTSVTIGLGETKTCTFVNDDDAPSLTLVKQVINDNGGTAVESDWTLTAAGYDPNNPQAGTYALSESGPSGYTQTSLTCDNAAGEVASVTLGLGEAVTCTFVNDDNAPGLTLVKQVINDNGGTAVGSDWTLTAAGYDPNNPQAGTYALSESGPSGYTQTSLTCDNAAGEVTSVTLDVNEDVTCTFVNDDDAPSLTLVKQVINDDFGTAVESDWTLTAAGYDPADPQAGTYALSESGPSGYTQTSLTCDNAAGEVTSVTLGLGENVTCTFVNDDDPPDINLAKTANGPATLEADGTYTVVYTVTASNSSAGGGEYDLTDTFSPAAGVTFNSATLAYVAGTENAQTGTLAAPPLANGGTWVTAEQLGAGLNESWTITANFTVDPAVIADADRACDANGAANAGFYNYVEGVADEVDLNDNDACTDVPAPSVNLSKVVDGPATLEQDGTYTVVYTVTASNGGSGPGVYDLTDTFSPAAGVTFNSAVLAYVAGSEDSQTGALATPPLANGGTWVTGEALAGGQNESWTITANFTVDPATVDPAERACDPSNPVINTGFYNAVSGVDSEANADDNATCTDIPTPDVNLAKTVDGPATLEGDGSYTVVYTVTATNSGQGPGTYDIVDTFSPATGITLNSAEIAYDGGETQSGTVTSPFASGATAVSGEALAGGGASETWTITANFTVDPAVLVPAEGRCDPANPVINTGFYNAVSGVDGESDTGDNEACTGVPEPSLNLAKTVNGPATEEQDGSYTVVYTITATNAGDGPGVYDLVDTFSPASGVTLNTATIAYGGGETQSGTITTPFTSGATVVSGETLAGGGASETWTVTANFSVDADALDPATLACDPANPVIDTGFYNAVSGVGSEANTDDNDTCTDIPPQTPPLGPPLDVPVNNPWALLMLLLSVLGFGWYYRPTAR